MKEINKITGRIIVPLTTMAYDAENIVVAMGRCVEALESIDYLVARGEKVGLIKVHLYVLL